MFTHVFMSMNLSRPIPLSSPLRISPSPLWPLSSPPPHSLLSPLSLQPPLSLKSQFSRAGLVYRVLGWRAFVAEASGSRDGRYEYRLQMTPPGRCASLRADLRWQQGKHPKTPFSHFPFTPSTAAAAAAVAGVIIHEYIHYS